MAAGAMGAWGLAGCSAPGPAATGGPAGSGPTELRFSWWGNDSRHKLYRQALDAYKTKHPSVAVTAEPTDWAGYWDRLATQTAGKAIPDVIQQVDPYIIEYGSRGTLADLSTYSSIIDLTQFAAPVLAASTVKDKVVGIPVGLQAPGIWANTKVFEQVGVPLPDDESWSWDDFSELTAQISGTTGQQVHGTSQLSLDEQTFTVFCRQRGQNIWGEGGLGFTPETLADWWGYVLRLMDTGASLNAQQSVEAQAQPMEQSPLVTGRTALSFGWASTIGLAEKAAGSPLKLLRMPGEAQTSTKGVYAKPSMHISVSATSRNGEEAARLADYLVNSPEVGEILLIDRGIPASAAVLDAVMPHLSATDQASVRYAERAAKEMTPFPVPPQGASALQTAFPRYTQDVLFKSKAPADAARGLIDEVKAALR